MGVKRNVWLFSNSDYMSQILKQPFTLGRRTTVNPMKDDSVEKALRSSPALSRGYYSQFCSECKHLIHEFSFLLLYNKIE